MIEKVVTWTVQKVIEEDIDSSVTTAALLGATLDSAAFATVGVPANAALVAGAATGAGLNICRKLRKGKET